LLQQFFVPPAAGMANPVHAAPIQRLVRGFYLRKLLVLVTSVMPAKELACVRKQSSEI
jgi:hypothetical protein